MKISFDRTWVAGNEESFIRFFRFLRAKYICHSFSIFVRIGSWRYGMSLTWKNRNPSACY